MIIWNMNSGMIFGENVTLLDLPGLNTSVEKFNISTNVTLDIPKSGRTALWWINVIIRYIYSVGPP